MGKIGGEVVSCQWSVVINIRHWIFGLGSRVLVLGLGCWEFGVGYGDFGGVGSGISVAGESVPPRGSGWIVTLPIVD